MEAQKATTKATEPQADGLETFEIDAVHTSIGFFVRHMVISNVRGRFTRFSGTILYDSLDNSRSSVSVTIDAASVNTENQERDNDLRSSNFFDTATFPQMVFKSKRIEPQCEGYLCVGDLTMHGVTKEISVPFTILGRQKDPWGNERLGFEGELKLDRRDFGLTYNSALDSGGLVVGNEVKIELNVEAVRK